MDAIWSPVGMFVAARAMGELHHIAAGHIHDENVEVSRFISTSPRKRYVLSIGAPRGVDCVPFPSAQAGNVCSVYIHSIYLRRTSASGNKHDIGAGLRVDFGFHFERPGVSDGAQASAVEIRQVNLRESGPACRGINQ